MKEKREEERKMSKRMRVERDTNRAADNKAEEANV